MRAKARTHLNRHGYLLCAAAMLGTIACGDDETAATGAGGGVGTGTGGADQPVGTTAIVAIVNPVVNDANNSDVPSELGTERDGIAVDAEPGENDVTTNGVAVVGVPVEPIQLFVGTAPALSHTVQAAGDLYDAAIGYDGSGAAFFEFTPIRYAVGDGSGAYFYDPDDAIADIDARLDEDDVVVVLRPGTYVGTLQITGEGVVLFGEGWSDGAVVIDGSIQAAGGNIRVRGLTITGDVDATGNNFGISFSVVKGSTNIPGNAGAYLRNVFCGAATVPSSSATLLDNWGIEPQTTLTPDIEALCAP